MILPSKHMLNDRALISIGADILSVLQGKTTVSVVWDEVKRVRDQRRDQSSLPFDWFILALTLLFAMNAVDWDGDHIGPRRA